MDGTIVCFEMEWGVGFGEWTVLFSCKQTMRVSEVGVELAFATPMNRADHVSELTHADIHARSISKQAVVEFGLVRLRVVGGITDWLSILVLCVATPHSINWLFAGQEVVRSGLEHSSMANINTDSVVFAVTVSVTKETDFGSFRDDFLDIDAEFVLGSFLLFPIDWVLQHLVIEGTWVGRTISAKVCHD
jgi:hypothetical protein